jgi:hypothetical protein
MSADKRKVSTDALETLGTLITQNEKRDAIHLAVIPAEAECVLTPGQGVTYTNGKATSDHRGIGIVDPFLSAPVQPGQVFWMVLRPRLITSLRHVWTHPALPDEPMASAPSEAHQGPDKAVSEAWLRDFCEKSDCPGYEATIAAALGSWSDSEGDCYGQNDGEYVHFTGTDAHGSIPPEFWTHLEIVTGQKITSRPEHFSCSC